MKKSILIFISFLLLLTGCGKNTIVDVPISPGNNANKHLGLNLDWAEDWSRTEIFNDLAKQARWYGLASEPWNGIGTISLNSDGWPTEDFGIVFFAGRAPEQKDVTLNLSFKCKGTSPKVSAWDSPVTSLSRDSATGQVKAKILLKKGTTQLFVSFTNLGGGATDIKLFRDGTDESKVFNDKFLALVEGFGVYRFMELTKTNNSVISNWSERTKPEEIAQGNKGIAWEYVIYFANLNKADIWINIPHLADDDYIKNLARLLKDKLLFNQNIYIEYSNEVWNQMFAQNSWNIQQASNEVNAGNSNLNYDCNESNPNASDKYGWGFRRTARRCREISNIFAEVFGKDQINKRIRVLIGGWGAVPYVSQTQLEYLQKNYPEKVNSYIYGTTTGSYIGEMDIENISTINGMFQELDKDINAADPENPQNSSLNYAINNATAKSYGVKNVIYEGGVDIQRSNYKDSIIGIFKDPRIETVVNRMLTKWYSESDDSLFVWYKGSAGDIWGFAENMDDRSSYVQKALRSFTK